MYMSSHTQHVGEKYVTLPVISFESVFEQSTPFSPIVFILSPEADPARDLGKEWVMVAIVQVSCHESGPGKGLFNYLHILLS